MFSRLCVFDRQRARTPLPRSCCPGIRAREGGCLFFFFFFFFFVGPLSDTIAGHTPRSPGLSARKSKRFLSLISCQAKTMCEQ